MVSTLGNAAVGADRAPGLFAKERTLATAGYNRWLVPPAALCTDLCIGMAYGFSVFWLPLSKALAGPVPDFCAQVSLWQELFTTTCNWRVSSLTVTFELFIAVLGISAAVFGGWLERAGPRKSGAIAACCWGGGLLLGALGVHMHQLWLIWLGCGVIGGIGQGLGYITPVSTLIRWFPDRRGMATGLAIMGYGGGAMIGAPLAVMLMQHFRGPTTVGAWQTLAVLGVVYFIVMMAGAFLYRVAPPGYAPAGWTAPPPDRRSALISANHVALDRSLRTPQFWLIWFVLFFNVTAGIGVIAMASPMLQEVFAGTLLGITAAFDALDTHQKLQIAAIAGGFTGLLSLFNILGRFSWATVSDHLGRKPTYHVFFVLGIILYGAMPSLGAAGAVALFVLAVGVIVSMYGGGFSTLPAYLADMFGTQFVGAIHGRLLTAWSAAGIVGPLLISKLREAQLAAGVSRADAYNETLYILCGLLAAGLVCNALIRPVAQEHHMSAADLADARASAHEAHAVPGGAVVVADAGSHGLGAVLVWLAVGIPLLWGVWITLQKASALF